MLQSTVSDLSEHWAHLYKAVVSQKQGWPIDTQVEDTVMAGADADAHTASYELQALAAFHSQHAPHCANHHCAVTAAGDGGILQRGQGIDDAVMAVCDAQHTIGKVVFPFGHCGFADTLNVDYPTCTATSSIHFTSTSSIRFTSHTLRRCNDLLSCSRTHEQMHHMFTHATEQPKPSQSRDSSTAHKMNMQWLQWQPWKTEAAKCNFYKGRAYFLQCRQVQGGPIWRDESGC